MSTKGFNFLVNHVIFAQLQMKTFNTTIKLFMLGAILNVTNVAISPYTTETSQDTEEQCMRRQDSNTELSTQQEEIRKSTVHHKHKAL